MNLREEKQRIREHIWRLLMQEGIARPPFPIWGRIPNFVGAEAAARQLLRLEPFRQARVVKVNPDSPQRPVRELCLRAGKTLIMPAPRIREGFLILNPMEMDEALMRQASTIRGAFALGDKVEPESMDKVDLIVAGSVAVSQRGERVGKGEGYSEIEYAILRMFKKVSDTTQIITTVHTLQFVDRIPVEDFDVPIDVIATEKDVVFTETKIPRPRSIVWELLDERKIKEIPLFQRLRKT